ncbi:hypothetical protein BH23ACI1_BH23ACI1_31340 [soil metagenome]|nr:DUF4242 domain-containing protein [Acidobacteriota bacterium]
MPKYLIYREIPEAANLTADDLQGISTRSREVLRGMGPDIQWIQSYVTGDGITCVYIAPNEEMIRTHASRGGFPATRVSEIRATIDPTSADTAPAVVKGIA